MTGSFSLLKLLVFIIVFNIESGFFDQNIITKRWENDTI